MADQKNTTAPDIDAVTDAPLDPIVTVEPRADSSPAFEADAFLAGKKAETFREDTPTTVVTPDTPSVIKRGGVGFFTALVMSTLAAGGGAYLALLAGSRPDLLQKAGIAAFVPSPPPSPSLGTSGTNIAPLVARISAVEGELLALKTRLDGTAPTPAARAIAQGDDVPLVQVPAGQVPSGQVPSGALATPPADTSAMNAQLLGISGRVTAIETRLAALDPTGAGGAIVAGLQADIAGLKAIIATLQQTASSAPSPTVTFAVMNLAEAANRPGPFMIEYEAVRAAMPGVVEVVALEPFALSGVPTRQLLQEKFTTLADAETANAAAIVASQKETGIAAWFRALLGDMIKVQPAPSANTTGSSAVLTRAKAKLDQGDLAGCVNEVATIATPSAPVTQWVGTARKRLELESRISAVRGAVGRPSIAPSQTVGVPAPVTGPVIGPVTGPVTGPVASPAPLTPLSSGPAPSPPTKVQGTNP